MEKAYILSQNNKTNQSKNCENDEKLITFQKWETRSQDPKFTN